MVSALSRRLPVEEDDTNKSASILPRQSAGCEAISALIEFINSNADLPTIEELAKSSPEIALALGKLH